MTADTRIDASDFARMFGVDTGDLPPRFHDDLAKTDTAWREPTRKELETYLLAVVRKTLASNARPPEQNQAAFEGGWRENLEQALAGGVSLDTLRPRYFREGKYLRYDKSVIVSDNGMLEHDLFRLARVAIFSRWLAGASAIYEFGCGSCANLLMLRALFPGVPLCGLDWAQASVEIANLIAEKTGDAVTGQRFDMLHPDAEFALPDGAAVLTVHALEQLGDKHGPWIEYLLAQRPQIVVHYEPILEYYDPDNLYDVLALEYSTRRGYLSGYLTALREREAAGRIEILDARRPCLGGVIHEASLVVWRPR